MKNEIEFNVLLGKTLVEINGLNQNSEYVLFICSDGAEYQMYHDQDCCESVSIDDIVGDVEDLLNSPILIAREDVNPKEADYDRISDSGTWTFYNIATIKGHITIKWLGESNGYYSERVDFIQSK